MEINPKFNFGFSKDVNTYMNSFITLCHTKAAAVLGASLTLSGLLLRDVSNYTSVKWYIHYGSITCLLTAAFFAASAIFPRLRVHRGGVLFWEDVRAHKTPEEYIERIYSLDPAAIEQEYAFTNWALSHVLHEKYMVLQYAISFLATGAVLAGISRIL